MWKTNKHSEKDFSDRDLNEKMLQIRSTVPSGQLPLFGEMCDVIRSFTTAASTSEFKTSDKDDVWMYETEQPQRWRAWVMSLQQNLALAWLDRGGQLC